MKLTKRQLKRIIREEYTRLKRRGLIKESKDPYTKCFDGIVRMLQRLDDAGDWWEIEDKARALCQRHGVDFGPVFTEALQMFGIDY